MKRLFAIIILAALPLCILAKDPKKNQYTYKEASELTLIGKVFPDTPNPYERMDFTKYQNFTEKDINLLQMSSGIAVCFKTDSPIISVRAKYSSVYYVYSVDDSRTASRGFDLYIKKKGVWTWAGACAAGDDISKPQLMNIVKNMDDSTKECMLYFPLYSKLESVKVAVQKGCFIEPGEDPFRYKVAVYGASCTQGNSTLRPGLTYPAIFSRRTGIHLLNLGVDGDCTMQPQFAEALKDADVDAFIFDTFANPKPEVTEANLFKFIEAIQEAHPGKPLIFERVVWRERSNFDNAVLEREKKKIAMYEKLMAEAMKKYDDIYLITPCPTSKYHDTSEDGAHFGDYGYTLWAESIIKPVTKILKKYGIK